MVFTIVVLVRYKRYGQADAQKLGVVRGQFSTTAIREVIIVGHQQRARIEY